ncbi:MAG: carbohydrate ABC transporter permease [Pseudobutyrivibrio sp.]|nr:carbohydrate ABC transporter permease [Pseudobutyrivibrio sp.]
MEKDNRKKGVNVGLRRAVAYLVLILITLLCLIWFYVLLINSTRSNSELIMGFTPFPSKYLVTNWVNVMHGSLPIVSGMINSAIVAMCNAVLCTYFSTMTAYAVHSYDFKGKKPIAAFILAVMMIPTQVTTLGFLQLIGKIGLEDKLLALILPSIAAPITYFYMKQYMESNLPSSLIEAARIDGSGEFKTFNTICIPLMKPAIAVQAIFTFVSSWNNYFTPALVIHDDAKKTLPILIAQLRGADFLKFDMGQVYVTIAFSIFPVIIVYLFLSKYIVGGVTAGGVKG